jgi:hypothetical protein
MVMVVTPVEIRVADASTTLPERKVTNPVLYSVETTTPLQEACVSVQRNIDELETNLMVGATGGALADRVVMGNSPAAMIEARDAALSTEAEEIALATLAELKGAATDDPAAGATDDPAAGTALVEPVPAVAASVDEVAGPAIQSSVYNILGSD